MNILDERLRYFMEKVSTVTIGTLVRDREFVLPLFLEHIYKINYDKNKIDILFLVNNSKDNSYKILKEFKKKYINEYNSIRIEFKTFKNMPQDERTTKREKIYPFLAELRNMLWGLVNNTDYLFSVDSDILITNTEILNKLISHKKHVISGLICNGFQDFIKNPYDRYNSGYFSSNEGWKSLSLAMINNLKRKQIDVIDVDLTGAICLFDKEIYQNSKNCDSEAFIHFLLLLFLFNNT